MSRAGWHIRTENEMQTEFLYAQDPRPVGAAFLKEAPVNSTYLENGEHLVAKAKDGSGFVLFYHLTGPDAGTIQPIREAEYIPVEAKVVALCP